MCCHCLSILYHEVYFLSLDTFIYNSFYALYLRMRVAIYTRHNFLASALLWAPCKRILMNSLLMWQPYFSLQILAPTQLSNWWTPRTWRPVTWYVEILLERWDRGEKLQRLYYSQHRLAWSTPYRRCVRYKKSSFLSVLPDLFLMYLYTYVVFMVTWAVW